MKATKIFGYNALICLFAGIFNEIFIELFLDGDLTAKEKIFGALAWCFLFECAFQIVQRFKRIKTLNMLTQKLIEITNQKAIFYWNGGMIMSSLLVQSMRFKAVPNGF